MAAKPSADPPAGGSGSELVPVLAGHRFDEDALRRYLEPRLDGDWGRLSVRQFQGGQSNPTFLVAAGERHYVLRKKPPGTLLPKAHQVEREYRVMRALAGSGVPVPEMLALCEDPDVIGTAFFVASYVEGRVLSQPDLAGVAREERRPIYRAMIDVLARLHAVDWRAAGLADFGRPDNYVARQVTRWSSQYRASSTGKIDSMDRLIEWLPARIPAADETVVAHGDYRLGNLIVHAERPDIVAVLDWELSTLGHPIADLAYCCVPYHLPAGIPRVRGLLGVHLETEGLPAEAEVVADYCRRTGRKGIEDWPFFVAFSLFRLAAIVQGVYARALQGNAADARALELGDRAGLLADAAWDIARSA